MPALTREALPPGEALSRRCLSGRDMAVESRRKTPEDALEDALSSPGEVPSRSVLLFHRSMSSLNCLLYFVKKGDKTRSVTKRSRYVAERQTSVQTQEAGLLTSATRNPSCPT